MNWHRIKSYIQYIGCRKNRFDIHSPFVYDYIDQVLPMARYKKTYEPIEKLRHQLLKNDETICITDLGTGINGKKKYERKISAIAKNSLKKSKYYRLLAQSIRYFNCNSILELGTSLGISTLYLAEHSKKVHTIEGCPSTAAIAKKQFELADKKNIFSHIADFEHSLDVLLNEISFDLVYIDGNHTYEATIRYTEKIIRYTKSFCVIVLDDIYWSTDMTKAWQEIKRMKSINTTIDYFEFGIAFINCDLSKENFVINY